MKKMTKMAALSYAVAAITGEETTSLLGGFTVEDVVSRLNDMVAQLDKAASEKPLTETQKQNIGYKADIETLLSDGKTRTASEILLAVPSFPKEMSNQRVSALLRQLVLDGKVEKEIVKGKSYFTIVGVCPAED